MTAYDTAISHVNRLAREVVEIEQQLAEARQYGAAEPQGWARHDDDTRPPLDYVLWAFDRGE